jgi:hypothetical protein
MAVMYLTWITEETIPLLFDELRIFYLGPVTLAQDFTVFNITPESIVVRQVLVVDDAFWPIVSGEVLMQKKVMKDMFYPNGYKKQVIDVDDTIKEILEKRN